MISSEAARRVRQDFAHALDNSTITAKRQSECRLLHGRRTVEAQDHLTIGEICGRAGASIDVDGQETQIVLCVDDLEGLFLTRAIAHSIKAGIGRHEACEQLVRAGQNGLLAIGAGQPRLAWPVGRAHLERDEASGAEPADRAMLLDLSIADPGKAGGLAHRKAQRGEPGLDRRIGDIEPIGTQASHSPQMFGGRWRDAAWACQHNAMPAVRDTARTALERLAVVPKIGEQERCCGCDPQAAEEVLGLLRERQGIDVAEQGDVRSRQFIDLQWQREIAEDIAPRHWSAIAPQKGAPPNRVKRTAGSLARGLLHLRDLKRQRETLLNHAQDERRETRCDLDAAARALLGLRLERPLPLARLPECHARRLIACQIDRDTFERGTGHPMLPARLEELADYRCGGPSVSSSAHRAN